MRATVILIASLLATPAAAQSRTAPPFEPSLRAAAALELASRANRAPLPEAPRTVVVKARRSRGPGYAFLVAGAAVAVAGLVADEDVLLVGGVIVAGYGLYLNVR